MRSYVCKKRKEVTSALGGCCLICGTTINLERHHIVSSDMSNGRGRGQIARLTDWLKNMDNLALLCTDHHIEYHQYCKDVVNHATLLNYILYKFIQNTEWQTKRSLYYA